MENLCVAVCEDSLDEQKNLLSILKQSQIPSSTYVFNNGESFLKEFEPNKYDLILMDIYMSGITGVDVVTEIRKTDENVLIAFITTSTEHTLESYRLNVIRYIEKPANKKAIADLLLFAQMKKNSIPKLLLRKNGKDLSLPLDSILYAEQKGHVLYIYQSNGETITTNEKLDDIANQFDMQLFLHCHKSYIVNLSYIKSIDSDLMIFRMSDNSNVHIRRESFSAAKKAYESYLFNKARSQSYHD